MVTGITLVAINPSSPFWEDAKKKVTDIYWDGNIGALFPFPKAFVKKKNYATLEQSPVFLDGNMIVILQKFWVLL